MHPLHARNTSAAALQVATEAMFLLCVCTNKEISHISPLLYSGHPQLLIPFSLIQRCELLHEEPPKLSHNNQGCFPEGDP